MSIRRYFDLEIYDVITLYVGRNECKYPLTFTIEECVEEYCETHNLKLVQIVNDCCNGPLRSGQFWYNKQGWSDSFSDIRNVQQAVTQMGSSMAGIVVNMRNIQGQMQEWLSEYNE